MKSRDHSENQSVICPRCGEPLSTESKGDLYWVQCDKCKVAGFGESMEKAVDFITLMSG